MYCPNCGTKNEDDSLFCMECGTRLKKDNVLNQLPHQETTPMQPEGRTVTDADIPKNRQSGSQNNENPNNKNQDTRNQNMGNQNENPSDIRRNGNPGGQNDYGQNYGNANPVNLAGRGAAVFYRQRSEQFTTSGRRSLSGNSGSETSSATQTEKTGFEACDFCSD